jgi:hypothetical protein
MDGSNEMHSLQITMKHITLYNYSELIKKKNLKKETHHWMFSFGNWGVGNGIVFIILCRGQVHILLPVYLKQCI